jgi:hypothetical protein
MKPGMGHNKGAAFERQIAKMIVHAFREHGIKQRECWRSTLSGGHAMSCGDLYLSDRLAELFPWAIECKYYRKIDWQNFLFPVKYRKKSWKEWQWIKQADDAVAAKPELGLHPLLVLKENRGPIYVMGWDEQGLTLYLFRDFLERSVAACRKLLP